MEQYVTPLAKAYLELYESTMKVREFFGLRDFYRWVDKKVYLHGQLFLTAEFYITQYFSKTAEQIEMLKKLQFLAF